MIYKTFRLKPLTIFLVLFLFSLSLLILPAGYFKSTKHSSSSNFLKNSQPVFIIDAGHGGEDGGTSAKDGTAEKGINLSISQKLNELLNIYGYKTVMTRQDDRLIYDSIAQTLRQKKVSDIKNRMKIIENTPNGILLSIHQNHFDNPKYSGAQVFYSKNNPLSENLAQSIQSSIAKKLQSENTRKIKSTGKNIYLLYHAQIPAVMIECGFLSNEKETQLLKDENYQMKIVFSIFCGILNYLENNDVYKAEVT